MECSGSEGHHTRQSFLGREVLSRSRLLDGLQYRNERGAGSVIPGCSWMWEVDSCSIMSLFLLSLGLFFATGHSPSSLSSLVLARKRSVFRGLLSFCALLWLILT